jgi:hypothetical protein
VSSATYTGISILKLIIAVQMMVSSVSRAETQILIEAGAVWQHRNDVQIPQMMVALEWSLTDSTKAPFCITEPRPHIFGVNPLA